MSRPALRAEQASTGRTAPNDAGRLIVTYLVLVFALSSLSYWPIISSGTMEANDGLFVLTLMWTPAVSAVATMLIHRRSLRGMGWRPGAPKYLLIGYLLPIAYAGVVYLVAWSAIPGSFDPAVPSVAVGLAPSVGGYVAVMATLGLIQSLLTATGEEIGWRGVLVPQLARVTSFTGVALISGVVWLAWHSPLLLFADYNAGAPAAFSLAAFGVMLMGSSFAYAWLRLRSGSFWPAAVLHASHNLFVQAIFDVMTNPVGPTPYVVGEFGVGVALAGVVVGIVFWRLGTRARLGVVAR